jgi:glycosyltransferase involved in cell wall biosynthesis
MFESVKDQVKYERRAGLESDVADPHERWKGGRTEVDDGWFSPISWEQAKKADIHVLHACIPEEIKALKNKKFVAVLHGPNEHMLWKEFSSGRKDEAFNLHINLLWNYDATVVMYEHEYAILSQYDEHGRLIYIPNSIDLERYTDKAIPKWQFMHRPAIMSCDTVRLEKLPAQIIWAMPRITAKIPDARLNLFGLPLEMIGTWRNLFCRAKGRKLEALCEHLQLETPDLRPFMKGADIGFNNNMSGIQSRGQMEMMAMGVPVIAYNGDYTPYIAKIWDLDSIAEQVERCWKDLTAEGSQVIEETRRYARKHFDRAESVKEFVKLYQKVLG